MKPAWRRASISLLTCVVFVIAFAQNAVSQSPNKSDAKPPQGVDANSLYEMAVWSMGHGKPRDALELLDRAAALQPDSRKVLLKRAELNFRAGKPQLALNDAQKILAKNKNDVKALQFSGAAYRALDEPQQAIAAYNAALKVDPKNAQTHFMFGNLYFDFSKRTEAEEHFAAACKYDPGKSEYHARRANNLRYLRRFKEALEEIDTAIKNKPKDADYYNKKSVIVYMMGDKKESLALLEKALSLSPNDSYLTFNLACMKGEMGDRPGALELYRRAVKLDPKNCLALNNLGHQYLKDGDYKKARKYLDLAIRANPKHKTSYLNRSKLFAKLGQTEESILDIEQARKLISYEFTMGKGGQGINTPSPADFKAIVSAYSQIIAMNSKDASCFYNRACAYFCLGQYERAQKDFATFLDLNKDVDRSTVFARAYRELSEQLLLLKTIKTAKKTVALSTQARIQETGDSDKWPHILIAYLNGKRSESQLLHAAKSTTTNTTCHFVIGINEITHGETASGITNLTWVQQNGERSMDEFMMSICELSRRPP